MSVYRLYSFTNYYLSSLQKGLQTAHVVGELAVRNKNLRERYPEMSETPFEQWSRVDRTIIILNGGNSAQLSNLFYELPAFAAINENPIFFREDEDSLGRAFTCVGILVPDSVWDPKHPKRDSNEVVVFRKFLEKFPLAV